MPTTVRLIAGARRGKSVHVDSADGLRQRIDRVFGVVLGAEQPGFFGSHRKEDEAPLGRAGALWASAIATIAPVPVALSIAPLQMSSRSSGVQRPRWSQCPV